MFPPGGVDYTTPLILAAAGGHTACVIELLEQGADPNARRVTGTTALFFAAQGGYVDVARILLKAGAPVDCSSVGGHEAMVSELLSHGANVHACMKNRDSTYRPV
uniref:ANK_REP_REGION domain-containing protein n=1 Tax=Anopheles epiroticus TaxID=199890 RepID=A0A182PJ15_9DIPT